MSEEKKITVVDFVKKFLSFSSFDLRKKYVEGIIIKDKYVDYLVKVTAARDIVSISGFDDDGNIKVNSCKQYTLYVYTLLSHYTNLDIESGDWTVSFDLLEKNDLIEMILSYIPEKELKNFQTVLEMCRNDFMTNNYEIHNFIRSNIDNVTKEFLMLFGPSIQSLNDIVSELDPKDVAQLIKNIITT